jgi:hypothetical protein
MAPSSLMMLMALLTQGGGSDLLDYVQSKAYWQLQGVEVSAASMRAQLAPVEAADVAKLLDALSGDDATGRQAAAAKIRALGARALPALQKAAGAAQGNPDKAAAIQEAIGDVLKKPKVGAVRRLMAIRTLGELKKREALDTLRGLLKSKAPFEADYARAAIAAVEGKPHERPGVAAKTLARDPWMLPADCGIVGQLSIPQGGGFDFDKALKAMAPMLGGQDPQQAMQMVTRVLLEGAERVGNVRLHSVTLGVASDVGPRKGFVVVVARGLYDAKAIKQLAAEQGSGETEKIDGVEVLWPDEKLALILPSNELLVLVGGPGPRRRRPAKAEGMDPAEAPQPPRPIRPAVTAMAAAVKKGSGSLTPDSDVGKLIKAADTAAPLWAVVKISDTYREGPIIQPIDTATLVGRPSKDRQTLELSLVARGSDADAVAAAVMKLHEELQKARQEVSREAERMAFLKPIADFLASIKTQQEGSAVTVTAQLKGAASMTLLPMMLLGRAGAAPPPPDMRAAPAPAPERRAVNNR